jgi:lipopolysaccharide transport system ATP-binding protein
MSSSEIAVAVRDLSKSYTIAHQAPRHNTVAEMLLDRAMHPLRKTPAETFWALHNIDLDIRRGEVVGIIGRNGAGKSTLLKILSRITEPTSGRIDLYGRVGSLLEVGTGFHPELTGRENVFLNGAILGMSKSEIRRQFDAIVDFAGVEQFLDTPVKRYSSGMYVRLAFAVAAHLQSEILIVDEVLAVGDAQFQAKCLGKMKDVAGGGRTVLFVSHNMQAICVLCSRGLLMSAGKVEYLGEADEAVQKYLHSFAQPSVGDQHANRRPGSGEYRVELAEPTQRVFAPDDRKGIRFKVTHRRGQVGRMYLSAEVSSAAGSPVAQFDSRLVGFWADDADSFEGIFEFTHPWLRPGSYQVDLYICANGVIDHFAAACAMDVSAVLPYPCSASADAVQFGVTLGDFNWTLK